MALRVVEPITPTPREVSLPGTVSFDVTLRDSSAEPGAPILQDVTLSLSAGNDLVFRPSGEKSVTRKRKVGRERTVVSLAEEIAGTGADLVSFKVALLDGSGRVLDFCLVRLA